MGFLSLALRRGLLREAVRPRGLTSLTSHLLIPERGRETPLHGSVLRPPSAHTRISGAKTYSTDFELSLISQCMYARGVATRTARTSPEPSHVTQSRLPSRNADWDADCACC